MYDYVLSFDQSPSQFQLCTNFPRRVYALTDVSGGDGESAEDQIKTLESVGIKSATQFFVHDLESDDEESDSE